jgi:hypothetical protein
MRDMESLISDLRAAGVDQNRNGRTGLASLLFDAHNRLIQFSGGIVPAPNHGGDHYLELMEGDNRFGSGE